MSPRCKRNERAATAHRRGDETSVVKQRQTKLHLEEKKETDEEAGNMERACWAARCSGWMLVPYWRLSVFGMCGFLVVAFLPCCSGLPGGGMVSAQNAERRFGVEAEAQTPPFRTKRETMFETQIQPAVEVGSFVRDSNSAAHATNATNATNGAGYVEVPQTSTHF
jgi:hypothetical protein